MPLRPPTVLVLVAVLLAGCLPAAAPVSLTVYSGRSQELVGPLFERFTNETGIRIEARYGDSAELAALLVEEGANSPADVYFSQDAGSLGAVAAAGLLEPLPPELLQRVPAPFRSDEGEWVGVSGRARVLVYDSRELSTGDLPQSVDELIEPAWRGRIGWAPTNGSFQAFVTAYRLMRGDDAARAWLTGMAGNQPRRYEGNSAIVQAVADGEVDVGLVNHYYLLRAIAEQGSDFPVRNHFFEGSDPGALINVAGAGLLATSRNRDAAERLLEFLLSADAQTYFAEQTSEYPLVAGVEGPAGVPPLAALAAPQVDLSNLADLGGTLRLLNDTGVLP